ncbi:hypothetical protein H5410_048147 [Solanum commersonii]|uniref:Secreted protein n=1 Tax=Solanum commersonii TaxID=4109 RepID=A0A9J5XH92_SOLCO|nr:hypothetical protein H5410_048147 [Solanum commersonii]
MAIQCLSLFSSLVGFRSLILVSSVRVTNEPCLLISRLLFGTLLISKRKHYIDTLLQNPWPEAKLRALSIETTA